MARPERPIAPRPKKQLKRRTESTNLFNLQNELVAQMRYGTDDPDLIILSFDSDVTPQITFEAGDRGQGINGELKIRLISLLSAMCKPLKD